MKKRLKGKSKLKSAVCSCLAVKQRRTRRPTVGIVKYKSNSSCDGADIQSFTRLKRSRSKSRNKRRRSRSRSRSLQRA